MKGNKGILDEHSTFDVVVVGAGLAGLSCAWSCLHAGLHVAVVDTQWEGEDWADTAIGLNCGLIQPMFDDMQQSWPNLQTRLLQETASRIEQLHRDGHDIEFRRCGGLEVLSTEEHAEHAAVHVAQEQQAGMKIEMLSAEQARNKEPHLSPHIKGALHMPLAAHVNPRKLMLALLAEVSRFQDVNNRVAAAASGAGGGGRVKIFWGSCVSRIRDCSSISNKGGRWSRVSIRPRNDRPTHGLLRRFFGGAGGMDIGSRSTVLAVGPHSQLLACTLLETHVPIMPVLGTIFHLENMPGDAGARVSGSGSGDEAAAAAGASAQGVSDTHQGMKHVITNYDIKHIITSYESSLFFAHEKSYNCTLALSGYRTTPKRRGEKDKGATDEEKAFWKTLKDESSAVDARPEVFMWRGRILMQPCKDDDGTLRVVEEGTGEVVFQAGGGKGEALKYAKDKLPIHHLQHLLCPPGVTHAMNSKLAPDSHPASARRCRHLYAKQAHNSSVWFGGDRITLNAWAPHTWRTGLPAPHDSTSCVRQHLHSLLPVTASYTLASSWQGVMAFSSDGNPYIGRLPCEYASNIYMLSALGSKDVEHAVGAGDLLAQLVAAGIGVDTDDAGSAAAAARELELERELGGAVPSHDRGVVPMATFYRALQARGWYYDSPLDDRVLVPRVSAGWTEEYPNMFLHTLPNPLGYTLNICAAKIYLRRLFDPLAVVAACKKSQMSAYSSIYFMKWL